jgi:PAS domain S-box-containing protein
MEPVLKILLLEDNPYDAELTLRELQRQGVTFTHAIAQNKQEFLKAIREEPDIILADYALPQFNAGEALRLLKTKELPIPVIVISGTIGEEIAVDMIRQGAADYLMKDRLGRLASSIAMALESNHLRLENQRYMQALEESTARYRSLFEDSPISLWEEDFSEVKVYIETLTDSGISDLEAYFNENPSELSKLTGLRKIVSINQATVELYEAEDNAEALEKLGGLFSEQSRRQFLDYVLKFYQGQTAWRAETEHLTIKGSRIHVSVNIAIAPGYETTWEKVFISVVDLTDLSRAQQQVQQSEALLRSVFDSSLDWIFVKDRNHRYVLANKAFAEDVGLTPEGIFGKTDLEIGFEKEDVVGSKHKTGLLTADKRVFDTGKFYQTYGTALHHTNGRQWLFDSIKSPLFDEAGNIWGVMGIMRDVTERHKTQQALEETRQNFEHLFNSLNDGVAVISMEGIILESNPVFYKTLGYTREEIIGIPLSAIDTPEYVERICERLERIQANGEATFVSNHRAKDGRIVPVEVNTSLTTYQGETTILSISRDITERLESEAALRASEEQYRLLFHTVPEMILIINNKLEILHANTAASDLTGYSLDELLTMQSADLAPTAPTIFDEEGNLVEPLLVDKLHTEITTKSGEKRLMEVDGVPIDFHGQPAFLIVAYDETERVQAERRIQESEEMLRTVIETIPQPLIVYDEEGRYLMGNHALAELLQTDVKNILGKTNYDLVQEGIMSIDEARNYHENAMIPLMTRQSYHKQVEAYKDPDGIQHYYQVYSIALQLPGRTKRVVLVSNEITEIMQARTRLEAMNTVLERHVLERTQDLEEARQQIDTILQHSPDGFMLLDADWTIQVMNPAFTRFLGIDPHDYLNQNILKIVSSGNQELFRNAIEQAIQSRQAVSIEHIAVHENQRKFDCLTHFSPIFDDGNLSGIVVGVHDISPQKEVQRMKDAFVSNVSHELRTPITNFICNLDLIRMNPAKQDIYLSRLDMEVVQLKNIIEDLLRLSRLDQGGVQVARIPIDLNVLCKDFTSLRTPLADQKNLSLTLLASGGLPRAYGDYGLITQVLSILLTNAINYTSKGGKIVIRTHPQDEKHGERVGFSVQDNGPGILPEDQGRIFERFYRGEAGLQSGVPGTGLGLPIAHEIIRRHDGLLELESSGVPGEGTTFTVWLPIYQSPGD